MSDSEKGTSTTQRFIGRVKWFNNKSGYGFITASTGDIAGSDIFVHHSSIEVTGQQYRYLVQGEYVEFGLVALDDSEHKHQTADVTGVCRGKLMCETHRDLRALRVKSRSSQEEPAEEGVSKRVPRVRGSGPRGDVADAQSKMTTSGSSEAMLE